MKNDNSKLKILENSCVFCQIVTGRKLAYKIYEDEKFLAFLDIRPLTKGNTLVIPKKHYRWVIDVPEFGAYWEAAKKIGVAAKKVLGAEWISFLTLGTEVPHAHIRVIPRYSDDLHGVVPTLGRIENLSEEEMEDIAKSLSQAVK